MSSGRGGCDRIKGMIAMDVALGAMTLSVCAAACVCSVLLLVGYNTIDTACRDAARAAGTADSTSAAMAAGLLACSSHRTDGFWLSQPKLDQSSFRFAQAMASVAPYVSTTTSCKIRLPALRIALQSDLDSVSIRRQYVFPAIALIQQTPTVTAIDLSSLIGPNNIAVPDVSGVIPGVGNSYSADTSE